MVVAADGAVHLYSYLLDGLESQNDLKRLASIGRYKRLACWPHDGAREVGAIGCVNAPRAPLIVSAASNREVRKNVLICFVSLL